MFLLYHTYFLCCSSFSALMTSEQKKLFNIFQHFSIVSLGAAGSATKPPFRVAPVGPAPEPPRPAGPGLDLPEPERRQGKGWISSKLKGGMW